MSSELVPERKGQTRMKKKEEFRKPFEKWHKKQR